MNQFTRLLRQGAKEVRDYCSTEAQIKLIDAKWLDTLAKRMEVASQLKNEAEVEMAIEAIAHSIIDCEPISATFAPSFGSALDALQRQKKKRKKV
jgi:hypothetical protein